VIADEALLLIGHGSSRYPDAGRLLHGYVRQIGASGSFREVAMGLLNGAPSAAEALARLTAPVIRIVPFFMENGYFSRVAVPRALGIADAVPGQLVLCPAVGVHDGMAELVARRVLDGCAERGIEPAATSIVIVGHGSARAPGRALALHRHVERVGATGRFAAVTAACLEEAPFVADALRGLRAHAVAVVGFFAAEGGHMRDDVPALITAEQAARGPTGHKIHNFGSVADTPSMVGIILDQAKAA
jgi:sirohydrochlorin cobaltochelatase